jgi:Tol biopolymer transport system component
MRLAVSVRCGENPSFSPDGKALAFDAPTPDGLGGQTSIMVANTDGAGIRTLSTAPFRKSVDPSWQPLR